ncbi:ExbD/TolR family protein [Hugenholtzia roseola]|uniref:ExbD/TolR family protein n=1 Tax=Hugenholtzia roseola TaxID=1002 RepID=UPI00040B6D3C|nr:biopolymer transporter ExbD [Hugenholtzia roseola]
MAKKKKKAPEVNSSSMADIAFLLLIFFLVTTRIDTERGLSVQLPPKPKEETKPTDVNQRNVYKILINSQDDLLIEDSPGDVKQIKKDVIKHLKNNGADPNFADTPQVAVVSIRADRGTSYDFYLQIADQVRAAYNEVRADYLSQQLGRRVTVEEFIEISKQDKKKHVEWYTMAKDAYPMNVSDAEPTGGEAAQ